MRDDAEARALRKLGLSRGVTAATVIANRIKQHRPDLRADGEREVERLL